MKILITGAKGMLAQDIVRVLALNNELLLVDIDELDICDADKINHFITKANPDLVIHCAAYTNVDKAESEKDIVYKVNAEGTKNIAVVCSSTNITLLYISTDFVFDGTKIRLYTTDDDANPVNIYGASKFMGEEYVRDLCDKYFIVRTSWLYGKYGRNFVSTMLRLAENHDTVSVVYDQIGRPTYAPHLSYAISKLIKTNEYGTYHISNNGQCSWYDFAKKIFEYSDIKTRICRISSEEFNSPAKRPAYSVMDLSKIENTIGYKLPDWKVGLIKYLEEN